MSSLQPLYDVKERLEYAAIAGTGLLGEDFRLRRAAEALGRWLAPYEAGSRAPIDLQGKEELDRLLSLLPGKSGPEICDIYRRMADAGKVLDWKSYTDTDGKSGLLELRRLGWDKCEGLAVNYCKSQKALNIWRVMQFIGNLPGDQESRRREGQAVLALMVGGQFFLRNGTPAQLKEFVEKI